MKILVVDDNRQLAENIAEILEDEGYEARAACGPHEALEISESYAFDVAVLDIRMPRMNGVALYRELAGSFPRATFVLMTAYSSDSRVIEALNAGVKAVLPKPIPLGELLELLPSSGEAAAPLLLVDDDPALSEALTEVFEGQGWSTLAASTVGSAKELARGGVAAAVIDVRLPDGDGTELARELVQKGGTPVVLVTGYDPSPIEAIAEELGPKRCRSISKPFDPEVLLDALKDLGADKR